jgi:hypothetical protein
MSSMSSIKKRRRCQHVSPKSNIWDHILKTWTKFITLETQHGVQTLHNKQSRKEYRFMITKNRLVSIIELNIQGANSETFLVKIHGQSKEGILKHFKPQHLGEDIDPILEAELQKYAHMHGLAPAVLASSPIAMISEKCQLFKQSFEPRCYKTAMGQSVTLRLRANQLHTLFSAGQQRILSFCNNMYTKIGMFNTDPNDENYMQLGSQLVQIDYGANRFNSVVAFNLFFNQLDSFYPKDEAQKLLINRTATYPPTYYWYKEIYSPEKDLSEEQQQLSNKEWSDFLDRLKKENQDVCQQLKAEYEEIKHQFGAKRTLEDVIARFHTYYLT